MTANSISNIGLQLQSVSGLQAQQTTLSLLDEQLASGQKYDNLTQYDPTTAKNLMDFQNVITQNQAYISGMQTVTTRLNLYNQTMGDMESVAADAQNLAAGNQTLDSSNLSELQAQAQNYLKQLTEDLNQQIGGRYIYAGTRYTTAPVTDLSTLTTAPTIPFTATTSPVLPQYDSQYAGVTINSAPSGNFQVGNTTISWADIEAGNVTSVDVNGTPTAVTVTGLTQPGSGSLTPAQLAQNLQTTINQVSQQGITDFAGLSAGASGATVSIAADAVTPTITPDASGATSEVSWSSGTDGTTSQTLSSSAGAFTADSVAIDSASSITYGVTSNNPTIQQLVAGLQFINAATQSGVSAANYSADMSQANSLLTTALSGLQSLNTTVSSNSNILANQTSLQNSDITNLQNEISNLQSVDLTQVGTEINSLQTQLQASYSATAALEQLSILKYL